MVPTQRRPVLANGIVAMGGIGTQVAPIPRGRHLKVEARQPLSNFPGAAPGGPPGTATRTGTALRSPAGRPPCAIPTGFCDQWRSRCAHGLYQLLACFDAEFTGAYSYAEQPLVTAHRYTTSRARGRPEGAPFLTIGVVLRSGRGSDEHFKMEPVGSGAQPQWGAGQRPAKQKWHFYIKLGHFFTKIERDGSKQIRTIGTPTTLLTCKSHSGPVP